MLQEGIICEVGHFDTDYLMTGLEQLQNGVFSLQWSCLSDLVQGRNRGKAGTVATGLWACPGHITDPIKQAGVC